MSMTRGRGRSRSRKFQKWAAPATLVPIPGSVAEPELFLAAPAPALAVWILEPTPALTKLGQLRLSATAK